MQVVSPYRPFAPESDAHLELGTFDWVDALRMLADSVMQTCHCRTYAITDVTTPLPVPSFAFETTAPRLMVWILDVSLAFLQSEHFDRDTVLICPDALVCHDLRPFFRGADLGVLVRSQEKHAARPLLNGCQFWAVAARPRLVRFYTEALVRARALAEPWQVWGGDTEPLRQLIQPMNLGEHDRHGLTVQMWEAQSVLASLSRAEIQRLTDGEPLAWPTRAILDFKYLRKRWMRRTYHALFQEVAAP